MGGRGSSSGGAAAGGSGKAVSTATVEAGEQQKLDVKKEQPIRMHQSRMRMSEEEMAEQFKAITDKDSTYTVVVGPKDGLVYDGKIYLKTGKQASANAEIEITIKEKPGRIIEYDDGRMPRQEFVPDTESNPVVSALNKAGVRRV